MEQYEKLIGILAGNGIECSDQQAQSLVRYYEMLIEKNKVMNLTAITDFEEVAVKHFADSLALKKVKVLSTEKVLDLGTGAGFPGIPLKIMYPDIEITLLDSLNKRLIFLDEVIGQLQLKGIRTVHGRAEELARKKEYREQYDVVVSRAVANLSTLVEYCLPYTKVGGCFISYKGAKARDEVKAAEKAITLLGGRDSETKEFVLENTDFERALIKIEKVKATPDKYPRAGGKPSSSPL